MSENVKTEDAQVEDLGGVDWVARAKALTPQIEAAADECEKHRRVTDEVMAALHDSQMFRMMMPRSIGGGEAEPMQYTQVLETIASADASTAWCLGQALGCSFSSAYVDHDVALDIFGPKNAVLAWGPGRGRSPTTIKVDGGYKSSGLWMFASGILHATWMGGHSTVCDGDGEPIKGKDGKPVLRTMLFPISECTVHDVWHVLGLRGTGSNNYEVKDLFVPDAYTMWRDAKDEIRETGPLYRMPILTAYGTGFVGIAMGVARATLDAFMKLAPEKIGAGFSEPLSESPVIQSQLSQSVGRFNAARSYLFEMIEAYWEAICSDDQPSLERRAMLRIGISNAMIASRDMVDFCYHAAGTSSIFESSPFERRFRDIHTLTQQGQAHLSNFQFTGQALFGKTPSHRL